MLNLVCDIDLLKYMLLCSIFTNDTFPYSRYYFYLYLCCIKFLYDMETEFATSSVIAVALQPEPPLLLHPFLEVHVHIRKYISHK